MLLSLGLQARRDGVMLCSQRLCAMTTSISVHMRPLVPAAFSWHNKQVKLASQMVRQTHTMKHRPCSNKKVYSLHTLGNVCMCVQAHSKRLSMCCTRLPVHIVLKAVGWCSTSGRMFFMPKLPEYLSITGRQVCLPQGNTDMNTLLCLYNADQLLPQTARYAFNVSSQQCLQPFVSACMPVPEHMLSTLLVLHLLLWQLDFKGLC